jgi:hypothetical protein
VNDSSIATANTHWWVPRQQWTRLAEYTHVHPAQEQTTYKRPVLTPEHFATGAVHGAAQLTMHPTADLAGPFMHVELGQQVCDKSVHEREMPERRREQTTQDDTKVLRVVVHALMAVCQTLTPPTTV